MKTPFFILWILLLTPRLLFSQSLIWHESSFEDFRDGTFGDGGVNTYVSASGRIQTIYRWDADNDGFLDLLFANSHSYSVQLDMSLFFGNGKDFDIRRHKPVPAWGPYWATAVDLNQDGAVDLVVCNQEDGTNRDMDLFVYYGDSGKDEDLPGEPLWVIAPFRNRLVLENDGANRAAVEDVNRDGHLDIVLANPGKARLFWGELGGGFRSNHRTDLAVEGANDVAISDLNGDDWPDLVFATSGDVSAIYWGSATGFSDEKTSWLPTRNAGAVEIAAINRDRLPDLLFANQEGDQSFAYLNRRGSFLEADRLTFETHRATDCLTTDFNGDGFVDIFFSNHAQNGKRVTDSYLYFGSEQGFSARHRQSVPTLGAWEAAASDLNQDGWPDLVVTSYKENDTFEVPSFIYWNSPQGFHVSRRTPLFTRGARGVSVADFDQDGHLDLLFVNTKDLSENTYHTRITFIWATNRADFHRSIASIWRALCPNGVGLRTWTMMAIPISSFPITTKESCPAKPRNGDITISISTGTKRTVSIFKNGPSCPFIWCMGDY